MGSKTEMQANLQGFSVNDDTNGKLNLKWNYYRQDLGHSINDLYRCRKYTDVTLCASIGSTMQLLSAHRFVLANCSSYFSDIFDKLSTSVCSAPFLIVLPLEITASVMRCLLDYMYTGETKTTKGSLSSVLKAGKTLGIKGLHEGRNEKEKKSPHTITGSIKIRTPDAINAPTIEKSHKANDGPDDEKRKMSVRARNSDINRKASFTASPVRPRKLTYSIKTSMNLKQSVDSTQSVYSDKFPTVSSQTTEHSAQSMVTTPEPSHDPLAINSSDDVATELEVIDVKNEALSEEENNEDDNAHQPKKLSVLKDGDLISYYCCRVCSKFFFVHNEWKRHMSDVHMNPPSKKQKQETTSTLLCGVCNLSFKSRQDWMEHVRSRHKL